MANIDINYKSTDIYESAFFIAVGLELYDIVRDESPNVFIFSSDEIDLNELAQDYWSYKGEVCPKKYADAIRSLKSTVFAGQKKPNKN